MKIHNYFHIVSMVSMITAANAIAQVELPLLTTPEVPNFHYEAVTSYAGNENETLLDVYIKISYDELQFVKIKESYRASYEISVVIFDASGDQQDGKIEKEMIEVEDFQLTNSREKFGVSKLSFLLTEDSYRINIGVMDLETRKSGYRRFTISVPDYTKEAAISDILFLDSVTESDSGTVQMHPAISSDFISESSEFKAYYEIYGVKGKAVIVNKVTDLNGNTIYSDKFTRKPSDGVIREIVTIRKEKLKFNKYNFVVEITLGEKTVSKSKTFQVRWFGMSESITDFHKAVNYLRYITDKDEFESMRNADEKLKRLKFIEFWKKRDPSPETETNELMIEYYRRIRYSNEHFSTFQEGWKADMGMIFILFGHPNDIERHPFDIDSKPYEVWYYYDINRNFVFQDFSGFGEYRLVTPLYDLRRSDF